MTVALARRLVWEGVIGADEASLALHAHVVRRVAFLKALAESHPDLGPRLEAELGPPLPPNAPRITADATLLEQLPPGLAMALLAVPVGRNPATRAIRITVADVSDAHAAAELSFHLGAPVEVTAAPLRAILAALAPPPAPEDRDSRTPAFGTKMLVPLGPAAPRGSEPPIPLVRVTEAAPGPTTVKGVAPQAGSITSKFSSPVVVQQRAPSAAPEPVIQLTRTKTSLPSSPSSLPPATLHGTPGPAGLASASAAAPSSDDATFELLRSAATPEDLIAALVRGLSRVARRVIVLAARGKVFEGKDASDEGTRQAIRTLVISGERPSVLLTAVQTGHYVGSMPQTLVHQELADALDSGTDEIAVGVITVSGRPALLYVAAGLETTYLATRRGDQLSQAASVALERIVRERKK